MPRLNITIIKSLQENNAYSMCAFGTHIGILASATGLCSVIKYSWSDLSVETRAHMEVPACKKKKQQEARLEMYFFYIRTALVYK